MIRITVKVDGMMCGMCEAHVNDAVRKHLTIKKVTSNHKKKETVILAEQDIPDACLESVITESGYTFLMGSNTIDLRPFSKAMTTALGGKGGGSVTMVQGTLTAKRTEIEEYLK